MLTAPDEITVSRSAAPLLALAFASELGWMGAAFRNTRLLRLTFGYKSREAALAALGNDFAPHIVERTLDAAVNRTIERLQAYAAGYSDDLSDVEVDYGVTTEFQRRVLDGCRAIPPGETLSYAQLATIAGSPGAARAVGNVMRSNKLPLVVPCHRVVGSGGSLGGYSGHQGLKTKRMLLEREGALAR